MDCILNLACYLPIGFLGMLAYARAGSRMKWVAILTAFGFAASYSVEALQLFLPARFPNLRDVIFNGAGTLLGAMAAGRLVGRMQRIRGSIEVAAVCLGFAWVCWQAFPFTPSRSPVIEAARWGWFQFWIDAGGTLLLAGVFGLQSRIPRWAVWMAALVNPLQAWFSSFSWVRMAGVLSGLAAGFVIRMRGPSIWSTVAWIGLVIVLVEPLFPWKEGATSAMEWRPFRGVFEYTQAEYLRRLFGRFYFSGCAILFAVRAGWGLRNAAFTAAALTAASIWIQTGLPGRQPDVTEVVMVFTAALVARLDSREA
jgi:VanZ family protein